MSGDVLIYVPVAGAMLKGAHQSSGGALFIGPPGILPRQAGARIIRSTDELRAIHPALTASDRLFATAWFATGKDKQRPGDGESWDAKDFDCP